MSDVVLGTLPDASAERDAIHVAIIPMVADRTLHPGERLEHGIVDPYLTHKVTEGERYWLCLYPQTVTGMRHHWSHPAFDSARYEDSELWLRDFCDRGNTPPFEIVMKALRGESVAYEGSSCPDYYGSEVRSDCFLFRGHDAYGEIPPEFWEHVEVVLGRPQAVKPTNFACSC